MSLVKLSIDFLKHVVLKLWGGCFIGSGGMDAPTYMHTLLRHTYDTLCFPISSMK